MRTYAALSIGLYGTWLSLAAVRVATMWLRSRTTGIRRTSGPAEALARVLMFAALGAGAAAPAAVLAYEMPAVDVLVVDALQVLGGLVAAAGITATTVAQFQMGRSWRVGVDESERTELVTHGYFRFVRNPIYSAMTLALLGFALLVPTVLSLASVLLVVAGVQVQARAVEEPFMLSVHPEAYARYAERVGRFVPGVGRTRR